MARPAIARCPRCVRGRGVRRAHSTAVDANYSRNLYCTVSLVLAPGQTAVLIATVQADSGADASVRWSSQTPSIVSVDQNGLVTGIATGLGEIIVAARGDTTKRAGASVRVTYSEVASAEIGSAGGVIAASSGFATLTIPPGVLQSSTNIRLSIDDTSSLAQRSPRITIEPDGMQFERPVRLEIHHSPAPGTLTAPRLYYHDPESRLLLQQFSYYDSSDNVVVSNLSHFSEYEVIDALLQTGREWTVKLLNLPSHRAAGTTDAEIDDAVWRAFQQWSFFTHDAPIGVTFRWIPRDSNRVR